MNTQKENNEEARPDQINHTFFSAILGLNIIMFATIAMLEYRAFKIASLQSHASGLWIEIEEPKDKAEADLHHTVATLARKMYVDGREAFRKCALCHTLDGETPTFGPHLVCVFNRQMADSDAAPNEGYRFSRALVNRSQLEGNWTLPSMHAFVADPQAFAANTRMPFPGLNPHSGGGDQKALRDVVQFLLWQCNSGPALDDIHIAEITDSGTCKSSTLATALRAEFPDLDPQKLYNDFNHHVKRYLTPEPLDACVE